MSHDFCILNKRTKKKAYFFGLAQGVMYTAFNAEQHFSFVSGDKGTETKDYNQTKQALDFAIDYFDQMGYPDPTRMDDIKQFRKDMENDEPTDTYEAWFG